MITPIFLSNALNDFKDAVLKRSKSLKNRFYDFDLVSLVDNGCEVAQLTLRRSRSPKSATIKVNVWPDRWIWVDAREMASRGWEWSFGTEGRLSGSMKWSDVIRSVEKLDDCLVIDTSSEGLRAAARIWQPVLLKGPVGEVRAHRL